MKKFIVLFFAVFVYAAGNLNAQNYDSVSGATQKEDGKSMSLNQFISALEMDNTCVFSTVNAEGTPNSAIFGHIESRGGNVISVGSMADTKTTKINLKERKLAIMLLILPERTDDDFDGAKVVLKYIDDENKIAELRSQMEEPSDWTTFFTVEDFLIYH